MSAKLIILKSTSVRVPRKILHTIYRDLLQEKRDLNLIFAGNNLMHRLNKEMRDKDYSANVLTFPNEGMPSEIYINIPLAKKEAKEMQISLTERITFLYIHGILHLLGYSHGDEMEKLEDVYTERYIMTYGKKEK